MLQRFATSTLLAAALVAWAGLASADILMGAYTINFGGAQSIWEFDDIAECVEDCLEGGCIQVCIEMVFQRDSKGKLTGDGFVDLSAEGGTLGGILTGQVSGKIKGDDQRGGAVNLKFKFEGPIAAAGQTLEATAGGKIQGTINASGLFEGVGTAKACVKGLGCEKLELGLLEMLPDGSWTLDLVVNNIDGKKLDGTGSILLPGGVTRALILKGKYSDKTDQSSLSAKGAGESKGVSVRLKEVQSSAPGAIDAAEVKYKVDGFKGAPLIGP